MYITFKVGSLLRLLTFTAVAAALVGVLIAGNRTEAPSPQPVPPAQTTTTQDLVNARP